jgi:hypothetical protein
MLEELLAYALGVFTGSFWFWWVGTPGKRPRKTVIVRIDKDGPARTPWRALVDGPRGPDVYYGDGLFWFKADDGTPPSVAFGLQLGDLLRAIEAGILDNDLKPLTSG